MEPITIAVIATISGLAWWKAGRTSVPSKMTPTVEYGFQKLLDAKLPAEKYIKAAEIFEAANLKEEGVILRKRGALAALPPEEKAKLTEAFGAAMKSSKPEGIRAVARVLHAKGAIGAAKTLRNQATTVEQVNSIPSASVDISGEEDHAAVIAVTEEIAQAADFPVVTTPAIDAPNPADDASGPLQTPGSGLTPEERPPVVVSDVDGIVDEE